MNSESKIDPQEETFPLYRVGDPYEPNLTESDSAVEGIFRACSINLLVGDSGSCKSYIALHCAQHVARGLLWIGHRTTQGGVLFVDQESNENDIRLRIKKIEQGLLDQDRCADPPPLWFTCLYGTDLREAAALEKLESTIIKAKARLVFLDALVDCVVDAEENSAKEMQPFFMALRRIANKTRAAIIVIHHTNRVGDYRGSSALKAAVDHMLMVKMGNRGDNSMSLNFESVKNRHGGRLRFSARANFSDDAFRLERTETTSKKGLQFGVGKLHVLRFLSGREQAEMRDVKAAATTCKPNTAYNALHDLRHQGFVERCNEGGSGQEAIYCLTDQGRKVLPDL